MIVLHGSWLAAEPLEKARGFVLWAETNQRAEMSTRALGAHQHLFAANTRTLRQVLAKVVPGNDRISKQFARDQTATVWLPSVGTNPQPSSPLLQEFSSGRKLKLAAFHVESLQVEPHVILALLVALPTQNETPPGITLGADLSYWRAAGRFALELITRQRFVPVLVERGKQFLARWQPLLDEPDDHARFERLVNAMPPLVRAPAIRLTDTPQETGPRTLLENFLASVTDAFVRSNSILPGTVYRSGDPTTAEAWLNALNGPDCIVHAALSDLRALYESYLAWSEPIPFAAGVDAPSPGLGASFRLCFRLEAPPPRDESPIYTPKPDARDWTLSYLLQASDDPSLLVPAEQVWSERGSTLNYLNRRFDAPQERMLAGLGHASRLFAPIEASLREARPSQVSLTTDEAFIFISETALLLQSFGFGVLAPNLKAQLGVRIKLQSPFKQMPKGGVAGITFDSILAYDWQLALGEQTLGAQEFENLAALKTPLVQIRGQWVELHPDQLKQALKFWEKRKNAGEINAQEALRLALAQETKTDSGLPILEVSAEGWIGELLKQLRNGAQLQTLEPPPDFQGTLRHYQITGLSWLAFLRQWGLGGILADDMGLGKTPQTIALLLHALAHERGPARPALVICPTSVVSNWQRELARFAPHLRVYAHQGAARKKDDLAAHAAQHDVVISSYPLLQRDEKHLTPIPWSHVILDEAQNIKNSATKQAQAARKLDAGWRLALTGTPVENRLAELWSLFQFTSPGYLGSETEFQKRFANPIERGGSDTATQQLKQLVGPFILRRVKTDPDVITDLPVKNEMKVLVNLTREQATLYEAVVRDSIRQIAEAEGIQRRGIVLATLMKLKQVCNHPAQFLGDHSALAGRSGKLARLLEMLDQLRAVDERALVFTQFAEMGKLLKAYLQENFSQEVLFLHGGTPTKKRTEMIERFQNEPHGPLVFLLSIKAGGTGLNLTRANNVFHFDRWWNPAVENQATDRAFRIGQTKNVQVYKYLCAGTFEEQIDAMIERKQELANSIVGTGEGWLTELDTAALRDLFKLRKDAVGD